MRIILNRRFILPAAVVLLLLALALWPKTIEVDIGPVTRGPLVVTVDDEGKTRVRDRFVVSTPVGGRVLRIELEPGDRVSRGTVVARVRAEMPALLDARSRSEAQAAIDAAQATLGQARAEEQRARTALAQTQRDVTRLRELARTAVVSQQELETREADARVAEDAVNAAVFASRAAASDLVRAQVRLRQPTGDSPGRIVPVISPVDGVVLTRVRESETIVPAGSPLVEIGDSGQLEIVADLLSTDAVRITPGARVIVENWGGDTPLDACVRRVEPSGFTKISALGVEEQRVNVIVDFTDPAGAWARLGDGYRVEVRVVIWERDNVLKVPTSALFRDGSNWAAYVVDRGHARRTLLTIGHQTGQEAEVLSGLVEGQQVVQHPGDTLRDGARVSVRR